MRLSSVTHLSVGLFVLVGCGGATTVSIQQPEKGPTFEHTSPSATSRAAAPASTDADAAPSTADVDAVAEALFAEADTKRDAALHLTMPRYAGDGSYASVDGYIQKDLGPWLKEERALIQEAEAAYAKIGDLKPAPSPRWTVDASARVAMLWGHLVAQYRAPGLPEKWSQTKIAGDYGSLRASFYRDMDASVEPLLSRAVAAYEKCHDDSAKLGYSDESSKACDRWLEKRPAP